MQPTYYALNGVIVTEHGEAGAWWDYPAAILAAWTYLWRLQWAEAAAEAAEVGALYASHGKFLDAFCVAANGHAALTAARLQAEPGRWLP